MMPIAIGSLRLLFYRLDATHTDTWLAGKLFCACGTQVHDLKICSLQISQSLSKYLTNKALFFIPFSIRCECSLICCFVTKGKLGNVKLGKESSGTKFSEAHVVTKQQIKKRICTVSIASEIKTMLVTIVLATFSSLDDCKWSYTAYTTNAYCFSFLVTCA